jgi:hypothetical protein
MDLKGKYERLIMWKKISMGEYMALYTTDHKVTKVEEGQDEFGRYMDTELDGPCKLKHRTRPSMKMTRDFEFWTAS